MFRILLYLFPIFVNSVNSGIFYFSARAFSEAGYGGVLVGCTISAWSFIYAGASMFLGKFVTERNCAPLIAAGAVFLLLASAGFLMVDGLAAAFVWIVFAGFGSALYCTPFQVFMKKLEPGGGAGAIVRPTALYTCSWSIGMAFGPFLFGAIRAKEAFLLNMILSAAIFAGVLFLNSRPPVRTESRDEKKTKELDYADYPDCAKVGWIACGIAGLAVFLIRAMEPYRGSALGFTNESIAYPLALLSLVQGATALCLIRSRTWMYNPRRSLPIELCGIAGLLLFGLGHSPLFFYAGAIFYGFYSGCLYFCFVFFSLAHPTKSAKYISVNEIISGLSGLIGPVAGGILTLGNDSARPFLCAAALVVCGAAFHWGGLRRARAGLPEANKN